MNSVSNDASKLNNSSMASLIKSAQDNVNEAALFVRLDFKGVSNPSMVQNAQSEASLANRAASMAYSMGYNISLSEFYSSPSASANYSKIYSDNYNLNYDRSLTSKISNNLAISHYEDIFNSAASVIQRDLKNPINSNVSDANQATSSVYKLYYNSSYSASTSASYSASFNSIASASYNNWYSSRVSSAYQLYYDKSNQINIDKELINSEALQVSHNPQAISAITNDRFLVNSVAQQIKHGTISDVNQQIQRLNRGLNIASLATSDLILTIIIFFIIMIS